MTRTTNSKFPTIKKLLVFILATIMCLSLFMATACKKDEDDSADIPEYSYTDTVVGELKNPSFTFGTQSMEYDDYPKTTVDGWTFSKVANSKSGVVDVSDNGWDELMASLYKDEGLLKYVKHINEFDDSDIRNIIKGDDSSKAVTTDEIKEYIINHYFKQSADDQDKGIKYAFLNPSVHGEATDNKVYMLNNYVSNALNYGCVQTVSSSTAITLNRGEYAKVSVWVKTANLNTAETERNYNKPIGANISVKSTFNGSTQSNYGIYNIVTDNWQQYTFYIHADDVFETTFTLQLGLGYENYMASGTAYFDDITVELLNTKEYNDIAKDFSENEIEKNSISYNNEDKTPIAVEASEYKESALYLYDMNVNIAEVYGYSIEENKIAFGHNTAENVSLEEKSDLDAPYSIKNGVEVTLDKPASYTLKINNNDGSNFKLNGESYAAVTFFVKNNLSKLYSTNITINVHDILGSSTAKRADVATITEANNEWTAYTIIVKNNFDKDIFTASREFYLEIVIGPDEYTSVIDEYALGTVTISAPIISVGETNQYIDELNKIETTNYQYYQLLSETSSGSTALYAGYSEDYAIDEDDEQTYSFVVASSNIGQILNNPATPKDYNGIVAGHYYITNNDQDTMNINTNATAGIINSKNLSSYKVQEGLEDIETALNHNDDSTFIQPLMIKTENKKSYGFISEPYTISPESYTKISLKVRVYAETEYSPTAYIYLVDTSEQVKNVLTLDARVNTDLGEFNNQGKTINKELALVVSKSMLDDNGWANVEFYIATGASEKSFRIELWNGARMDDPTTDKDDTVLDNDGYVFFNDIEVVESTGFIEPTRWQDALSSEDSPLYNQEFNSNSTDDLVLYKRELTDLEKKYNSEGKGNTISYDPSYIWAKNDKLVYAVYNTIDPVEIDPYATDVEEDTTTDETSLYESDPATFWLSLSSIIIGAALILAIIMLFIKNIRRRRKANKNDAKSHYTVRSRTKKPSKTIEEIDFDVDIDIDEPTETEENTEENSLDSYVYGDVQVFGEDEKSEGEETKDND